MQSSTTDSPCPATRTCWTQAFVRTCNQKVQTRKTVVFNQRTQTCSEDFTDILPEEILLKAVRLVDIFSNIGWDPANGHEVIWMFLVDDFPNKVATLKDELMLSLMKRNTTYLKKKTNT